MSKRDMVLAVLAVFAFATAGIVFWVRHSDPTPAELSQPIDRSKLSKSPQRPSVVKKKSDAELKIEQFNNDMPTDEAAAELYILLQVQEHPNDYSVQRWANKNLDNWPANDANVDRHLRLFFEASNNQINHAFRLITNHEKLPARATPELLEGFTREDLQFASYCTQLLRKVEPKPSEAVGPLLELTQVYQADPTDDRTNHLIDTVVSTLRVIGSGEPELISELEQLNDFVVKQNLATFLDRTVQLALARQRSLNKTEEQARALIETLDNPDSTFQARAEAAELLGTFTKYPKLVTDALTRHHEDAGKTVRHGVIQGLASMHEHNPDTITALLCQALDDRKIETRIIASNAISMRGKATPEAISTLTELTMHRDDDVRWRAISALLDMKVKTALPAIRNCLQDSHPGIRQTAEYAVSQLSDGNQPHD